MKKYITINGPTDTKVFGRQKKRPISAKTKTNVLSNAARIITFLSKKNPLTVDPFWKCDWNL